MREKITKNRNYILMVLGVLILSTLYVGMKYLMLPKYKEIPEVKLKEIEFEKGKAMAIMVTNDNGIGYKEYEGEKWPENYNFKKAECVDVNGEKLEEVITIDKNTNKVTLKTNKTVYCTLYFDREKTILDKLRENDKKGVISKELVGELYRYQGVRTEEGVDDEHLLVDNNYLCFGTNNEGECKDDMDKYMYRIIGVTANNELKVIKETGVEEGGIDKFVWNDTYYYDETHGEESCPNGECPEWPDTTLYKRLNGLSNGSTSGSRGDTDIFINNDNYPYMVEGNSWYNLIEDHEWMYGDVSVQTNATIEGEMLYGMRNDGITIWKIETGQLPTLHRIDNNGNYEKHQWSKEKIVKAKIGLMYLHDYYLAYDNERPWDNRSNQGNASEKNQINWMLKYQPLIQEDYKAEWTMVRSDRFLSDWDELPNGLSVQALPYHRGTISNHSANRPFFVRPVFYIKSEIELEGSGTEEKPYIITNKNEDGEKVYNYEYTGSIREFVAPEAGTYKLEVWGAQGGAVKDSTAVDEGGLGGYSVGEITLASNEKLFVVVGGQGEGTDSIFHSSHNYQGGYNGGGNGGSGNNRIDQYALGGGGATHIAKETGLLSTLSSDQILIVAGGGGGNGGSASTAYGGSGGGFKGTNGTNTVSPYTGFLGTGATQGNAGDNITENFRNNTALGKFGQGGNYYLDTTGCKKDNPNSEGCYGAGGGGGYYGGGGSARGHAGGGGGSGYIGNDLLENKAMYCYKCEANDDPKTVTTTEVSAEPLSNTAKKGNGFARITKIS